MPRVVRAQRQRDQILTVAVVVSRAECGRRDRTFCIGYHRDYSLSAPLGIRFDLVLPDTDDGPTGVSQTPMRPAITRTVSVDLLLPVWRELVSPLREHPAVPKIPVDKHNHTKSAEDDVRAAREMTAVGSISKSLGVKQASERQLRLCVRPSDA